jgi:hypothetical protein
MPEHIQDRGQHVARSMVPVLGGSVASRPLPVAYLLSRREEAADWME